MRQHFTILLIAALILFCTLGGCTKSKSIDPSSDRDPLTQICGFKIDNDTPLESLLSNKYSLSELTGWFPSYSYQEYLAFHYGESIPFPTFEETNNRFPVQCLRWNYNRAYTVYRVREGGYFFVFWGQIAPLEYRKEETTVEYAQASFTAYLDHLPSLSDFSDIEPGKSTGKDVKMVDPSVEWSLIVSSGSYSCSLLEDGRVLGIYYEHTTPQPIQSSVDDMVVSELVVYQVMGQGSFLGAVLPADYP